MTDHNITTAKLLALLNASATLPGKRKRSAHEAEHGPVKLNKRRPIIALSPEEAPVPGADDANQKLQGEQKEDNLGEEEELDLDGQDAHVAAGPSVGAHFSNTPGILTPQTLEAISPPGEHSRVRWKTHRIPLTVSRSAVVSTLEGEDRQTDSPAVLSPVLPSGHFTSRFWKPFERRMKELPDSSKKLQEELLPELAHYRDVYHNHISASDIPQQEAMRDAVTLHLINHAWTARQNIIQNNQRLEQGVISGQPVDPESVQDQGFTRPSTLILVPFRNSALRWITSYLGHFPNQSKTETQIHNRARFTSEFSLPEGTADKLAEGEDLGIYPTDHVQTFKGNIDDNFRAGIKVTKRAVRLFEHLYGSDLIIASPLGLRFIIEKNQNDDLLSSIEIVVIDQADVMTMQNWVHLQFVISHLNNTPKESHDTDFSRVKSWYLDGHAKHLRQTILFSSYETPQMRAFFTNEVRNLSGKIRFENRHEGVRIPEGIKQDFIKFECNNAREEVDKRFEYFTREVFPEIRKSAVQSANTLIVIPSYFDFIRVRNWMTQDGAVSVAFISEESSGSEITKARQKFFVGKVSFLVITERFHFYRRYKLKGILNIIFYAPPDHSIFYSELLSFPFLGRDIDGADITCKTLYSKYDAMALERIVGIRDALTMIKA
ncbi:rRNA-binding ribosome biosynthesis protein utp25 [Tulasnella sp. JGI-2019a]|nr:rRNA-binding ribosome biosynthesis protein utp25 [Tulasnella sp. JGI-2019a]